MQSCSRTLDQKNVRALQNEKYLSPWAPRSHCSARQDTVRLCSWSQLQVGSSRRCSAAFILLLLLDRLPLLPGVIGHVHDGAALCSSTGESAANAGGGQIAISCSPISCYSHSACCIAQTPDRSLSSAALLRVRVPYSIQPRTRQASIAACAGGWTPHSLACSGGPPACSLAGCCSPRATLGLS